MTQIRDRSGAQRVAFVSVLWTAAIAAVKVTVGVATGSVAILGDGLHSLLDVVASGLTFLAIRVAARPPDREHPYGHGRAENLAVLAECAVMLVVGAGVAWEALRRLTESTPFDPPIYALVVAAGAIVVDTWRAAVLRRAAKRYNSPALEADAMNYTADIAESAAVLVGLLAGRFAFPAGDPIAALVVVAAMWFMAVRLGTRAVDVLMDRRPTELSDTVARAVEGVAGVVDVGDVRMRQSGAHTYAEVTLTVGRTASVEQSHDITEAVEAAVANAVPGAETTVHVEPSAEGEDVIARTFAAANRVGLADQVHNVMAIRHPEGLWLTLHAMVRPQMSLARGHHLTLDLERELHKEIDGLARVEIHLEPRVPRTLRGKVVTADRGELTKHVARLAESHAPIAGCHEVAVSESTDGLHLILHCDAPAPTPIVDIHAASLRLEAAIHAKYADVRSVTVHFEPSVG